MMIPLKTHLEGAQRSCTPRQTLERMRPYFCQAGISRVGLITGMDRLGIPVAQCVRPDAMVLSVDSGKGMTDEQAMASAVMEGFERCVGERYMPRYITQLERPKDKCLTSFPRIEGSAPEVKECEWSPAHGLLSGQEWLVPTDVLRMQAGVKPFSYFCSSSNGLSSGNTISEAIVGGLYEVIERDSANMALIQKMGRLVSQETIADPVVQELLAQIDNAKCKVLIFDLTGDVGVPTYTAYLYDWDDPFVFTSHGTGTHLHPYIAMARSITESAQARAVWLAGSRDDISHERFQYMRSEDARTNYAKMQSLGVPVSAEIYKDKSGHSFSQDTNTLVEMVMRAGLGEPLVVTMEHSFPCAVVRVIGPGMSGYFGNGTQWGRPQ